MERFQPNFWRPIAAKLWMGPKNVLDLKWWHGPPLSPCKIWWKSRHARRRERTKCDVFIIIFLFFCNAPGTTVTGDLVALLQQEIALVFLRRFRCGLQRFVGEAKPFPVKGTELLVGGATIRAVMPVVRESGCKVCVHHFDHLKARWKKTFTIAFYSMYYRCAPV